MTADAALLSAIYDNYDSIKPILPQEGAGTVEYVMVTDSADIVAECTQRQTDDGPILVHPTGWTVVYEEWPGLHPNRAAKHPKMLPTNYTTAPASVWLDASFLVVSTRFVADLLTVAAGSPHGVTQFPHPWRQCVYAEARESAPHTKYLGEPIMRQAEGYRTMGMPENYGLWATGIIGRIHSARVDMWGRSWLDEIEKWSFQDQISHPFVCWSTGVRPANLPGNHMHNPWIAWQGSARHG